MTKLADSNIPDVFKKQTEKDARQMIDYAIDTHSQDLVRIRKISKLKRSYRGKSIEAERLAIEKIGEKGQSKVKYVDYRPSNRVINRKVGEWLEMPLKATVTTINLGSKKQKEDIYNTHAGLNILKEPLQKLRDNDIANPFGGMPAMPMDDNGQPEQKIKLHNEIVMQYLANTAIKKGGIKDQLYQNYLDLCLGSESFGKRYIDTDGFTKYRAIDIRNALFQESENDIFCEQSPYMGEKRQMYIGEIAQEFPELKSTDIEELRKIEQGLRDNDNSFINNNYRLDNQRNLLIDVYFIEYKAYEKWGIQKNYKDKDGNDKSAELSEEYYVNNKGKLASGERKGKWKIEIQDKEIKYKIARIGKDKYVGFGPCENIPGSYENPFHTEYDYVILLFNRIDGESTSLMELMEELKGQYNIVRFQINRELVKFKGMQLTYDRAYLPKTPQGTKTITTNEVIIKMINDGLIDFNSAQDSNLPKLGGKDGTGIDVKDLGFSKSMPTLIAIAQDIERTMDMITGFNQERQGQTPASSTATNATNNLQASRSVTAPMDYFFDRFVEKVLCGWCERAKITYGDLHPELGKQIVGEENMPYLQENTLSDDDYGVYIGDSRREEYIRQIMRMYMPQAINGGYVTVSAALQAEMADTLAEARLILLESEEKLLALQAEQAKNQEAAKQQGIKEQLEYQDTAYRNKIKADAGLETLKSDLRKGENSQQALQEFNLNEQGHEQDKELAYISQDMTG